MLTYIRSANAGTENKTRKKSHRNKIRNSVRTDTTSVSTDVSKNIDSGPCKKQCQSIAKGTLVSKEYGLDSCIDTNGKPQKDYKMFIVGRIDRPQSKRRNKLVFDYRYIVEFIESAPAWIQSPSKAKQGKDGKYINSQTWTLTPESYKEKEWHFVDRNHKKTTDPIQIFNSIKQKGPRKNRRSPLVRLSPSISIPRSVRVT
jgi:hypothetical protein